MELERRQLLASVLATPVIPATHHSPISAVPAPLLLIVDRAGNKHDWDIAFSKAAGVLPWQGILETRHLVDVFSLPEWTQFVDQDCWNHAATLGADTFSHQQQLRIGKNVSTAMWFLAEGVRGGRLSEPQDLASRWIGVIVSGESALDLHLGGWMHRTCRPVATCWLGRAACVSTYGSNISTRSTIPNLTREDVAKRCLERLHALADNQRTEFSFGMINTRKEVHFWI